MGDSRKTTAKSKSSHCPSTFLPFASLLCVAGMGVAKDSSEEHTSNNAELAAYLATSCISMHKKDATGKKAPKSHALASFHKD
eukprot:4514799-Ditylum_brightwellii.AAC.1